MENTSDKSFVSHNSNKPFIRTMADDLKKIKNSPVGNDGAASVISSLASASHRESAPRKEINRPTSAPVPTPIPTPAASVPKNLPVDMLSVKKEESEAEAKTEKIKPIERPKTVVGSNIPDNRVLDRSDSFGKKQVDEKKSILDRSPAQGGHGAAGGEEKNASVSKPIASASINVFSRKPPSWKKPVEEVENLSPEARLARQSSLDVSDSGKESKESLAVPPLAGIFSAVGGQSSRFARPFNSIQSAPSPLETKKRSIEEIIKEDSSDSFFRKFVKIFIAVLIIAGIALGAYYFYTSKKPIVGLPSAPSPSVTLTFIAGAKEAVINTDLNSDSSMAIKSYFSNSRPSGIYRLILKDKDGQRSLGLENLGKSLNIVLPNSVANALEKDYNLIAFNYPEKKYLRLGLILKPKNSFDVSASAGNWEPEMYRSIEAIFLGDSGIYDSQKQFSGNKYNNFDIRYLPLGSENVALNYAIDNEKKFLLIATSKQDIFDLIDKIIKGK